MASESEKRKYPRAKIRWPVSITTPQVSLTGVTKDISPGGFSIHLEKPVEMSLPLTISTNFATAGDTLELTGEVVWSSNHGSGDEGSLPSIGVRFTGISYAGEEP